MGLEPMQIIISIGLAVLIAGIFMFLQSRAGRGRIRSAKNIAARIVDESKKEAETQKKQAVLEAKEEWYKAKEKFDSDTEAKRRELQKIEKRISDKEASQNRRVDLLDKKDVEAKKREGELSRAEERLAADREELRLVMEKENQQLERIAAMSQEEAKKVLMQNLEEEARHASAKQLLIIRDEAKRRAEKEAQRIVVMAIQRCAADHSAEITVSVVTLQNDEMKGRIIGREGRNIRAFEAATGIDVIIDDTPGAVVLSGFDPVRREIARASLERLITDGRIHPGRIEELVAKASKEMDDKIQELGEQTTLEMGIVGLHPRIVKLLGRLHYRTSYGQNVLQHSKEVGWLCGIMAAELRMDATIAKRAGLLHDIGKALTHEVEGIHSLIGADVAEKCGEQAVVVNAIRAHHEDVEAISLMAPMVQAADAISGARPGARGETLETYIQRLERLENIAKAFKGVEKCYAIQAGREIRIMVEGGAVSDEDSINLSTTIARKIEKDLEYPGQIKVTVIRETRAVEYAR